MKIINARSLIHLASCLVLLTVLGGGVLLSGFDLCACDRKVAA